MALIGKIREQAGLTVGIVAIGLVLFLVGRDLFGLNPSVSGRNPIVAKVAGKKITLRSFQDQFDTLQRNFFLQYDRAPSELEKDFLRDQAWQQLLANVVYARVHDALGITVSEDELVDMVQGEHIHPELKAAFTHPETKEFDKKQLLLYLQRVAHMPAAQQAQWHNLEQNLATTRCNAKFNQLMKRSVFVTNLEAQEKHKLAHTYLAIRYLYVPYYTIQDDQFSITDTMLKNYLKAHKNDYQVDERRGLRYITFPITPTEEDTMAWHEELQTLQQSFMQAQDDSVFASIHTEGDPSLVYLTFTQAQLPQALVQQKADLQKGLVIGPIEERKLHKLYKVVAINAKEPKQYEVAVIEKKFAPGDEARDKAFRKADYLASSVANKQQFEAQAAQDTLQVYHAQVGKNDSQVGVLSHAREIVRWLYNDATINKVSPVFELADDYVVALMTDHVKEGTATLDKVRDEITRKVINEKKARAIMSQLQAIPDTTLEALAVQYGAVAKVLTTERLKLRNNVLQGVGMASKAIGRAFALKKDERSTPIADDHGVLLVELVERHEAEAPESLGSYKYNQEQLEQLKQTYYIPKSLEEFAQTKDYRYRFY